VRIIVEHPAKGLSSTTTGIIEQHNNTLVEFSLRCGQARGRCTQRHQKSAIKQNESPPVYLVVKPSLLPSLARRMRLRLLLLLRSAS
jgi:hypothetical protein